MSIYPIEEGTRPLPEGSRQIENGAFLSQILGPCLRSALNSYRKMPFDVNLPTDLIDEEVNQTAVTNTEQEIERDARDNHEAALRLLHINEQRPSHT